MGASPGRNCVSERGGVSCLPPLRRAACVTVLLGAERAPMADCPAGPPPIMLKLLRVGRANHASSRSTCGPAKAHHVNRLADLVAGAAGNACPLAESALGHVPWSPGDPDPTGKQRAAKQTLLPGGRWSIDNTEVKCTLWRHLQTLLDASLTYATPGRHPLPRLPLTGGRTV